MKTVIAILTLLTLHSQLPTLNAQWPTTPDSGLIVGYGDFPSIVSDDDGGAIVAFRANNPSQIKVKRVDKYGYLQWNGFSGVVAGGIADWQDYSDIAEDGRGGVLVSFQDIDCYTDCHLPWMTYSSYVTVNRIDHLGNKLWGEGVRVTVHDTIIQNNAQVRSDAHAGAIISWLQNGYIYVQRIDSMGSRMWGDTGVVVGSSPEKSLMIGNENGDVFLRYGSNRIQKLDLWGNKIWGADGAVVGQVPANIGISNRKGGLFLGGSYYDFNLGVFSLRYQQIDSTATKLWGEEGLALSDSINIDRSNVSSMVICQDDTLFLAYHFAYQDNIYAKSYVQKISPSGKKLFLEYGVTPTSDTSSTNGIQMATYNDSILCAWNDARGGTYAQKIDRYGNKAWNQDIHFSARGIGNHTDDRYGGIVKWHWNIADFSINLQKISRNGNLGEVLTEIEAREESVRPNEFDLYQNYPNPFNPVTTIRYNIFQKSRVELEVYNILGEEVKVLYNGVQSAGYHRVEWNGRNEPGKEVASGIYFCALKVNGSVKTMKMTLIR